MRWYGPLRSRSRWSSLASCPPYLARRSAVDGAADVVRCGWSAALVRLTRLRGLSNISLNDANADTALVLAAAAAAPFRPRPRPCPCPPALRRDPGPSSKSRSGSSAAKSTESNDAAAEAAAATEAGRAAAADEEVDARPLRRDGPSNSSSRWSRAPLLALPPRRPLRLVPGAYTSPLLSSS